MRAHPAVRAPTGQLVGVTMILADCKSIGEDTQERLLAAPVRAIMQRLAVLLKPAAARRGAATPELITPEQADDILEFELSSESASVPARHTNGSKVHSTIDAPSDMPSLEFLASEAAAASPTPPVAAAPPARRAAPAAQPPPSAHREGVPPASEAAAAPQGDANLTLEVLPYAKLRPGGQSRRFQIQARFSPRVAQCDPAVLDALILQRLVAWLAAHRTVWNSQPTTFTVGVSIGTLEDDHFAQKVAAALNAHGIAAETLGFEIAEALCTQHRAQAERFIAQCEKLGASVVIDDFSFDAQVLPLLRSKAVRLVKIDPKLSSSALKDKLAQALVIATVQAAKVLGIHCAARRVDSQAAAQWLGAVGCDFGQGGVFAPAKPLEALVASPDATGLTTLIDRRLNKSGNQ